MNRKVFTNKADFDLQNNELGNLLPYSEDVSILKSPYEILNKTVSNRLVCQAMEGCDGTKTGEPDELTVRRYLRLAEGGAGIIWFEATACCEEGRANPRQLWIREDNVDQFKRLNDLIRETAIKRNGYAPLIIMQDTHSGRYSKPHGTPEPIIAYNNPIFEKDAPIDKSRIITDEHLDKVRDWLVDVARLAQKAGFDGVDIKCCHRYLNSELLSAFTRENSRYGGSFENRTRLLRETIQGALQVCDKDFIVSSRMNAYDGFQYPYGFGVKNDGSLQVDLSEAKALVKILSNMGVKLLNITMGNPYVNPHVNRPFAKGGYEAEEHPLTGVARMLNGIKEIHEAVPEIKLISSGFSYLGTVAPNVAAQYISDDSFQFAGFGRMIFAYPDFANAIIKKDRLDDKKICIACSKCTELMRAKQVSGCAVFNEYYRKLYKEIKT
ncbi:MAG: flavin oxidoreductase/NADH oxidase [Clostridia bacterium]|nr:flavin oxidoreductase/NADH oxidase [Clostridia bacterium]